MPKQVIFDKKNVLVTGGAGFIGSHLCDELIKEAKVICLDNFSTGDERNIDHLLAEPNFEFVKHDITAPLDLATLPELQKFKIQFQGIQEIYHLACPMSPKNFKKNIIAILLANSLGVKVALDLAVQYQAKFVHFSSSVVYGPRRDNDIKIKEDDKGQVDLLSPRSSYDEGKRFAETIVANYRDNFKIDAKIIRLFRIYGPRMKLNDGQMIPDFISQALANEDLVIYGGKDFASAFCYVDDCVDAVIKMMSSDLTGPINIGSDVEVNLTELANKIISNIGAKSSINYTDEMLFMSPLCLPDISRARSDLGWLPVISLEKGLEKTIYELRASTGLKGVKEVIGGER